MKKYVSEIDDSVKFSQSDFQDEVDSTLLVRERVRGSKLDDGLYKKMKGTVVGQSEHTITVLPNKGEAVVCSKRDVAKSPRKDEKTKGQSVV